MAGDDVALFREVLRKPKQAKRQRTEPYTLDTFRAEFQRRIQATGDDRNNAQAPSRKRKIPTGAPKLGDNTKQRRARLDAETRRAFYAAIVSAVTARLELLRHVTGFLPCPWAHLGEHTRECRCWGTNVVSVERLVAHYESMLADYQPLAAEPFESLPSVTTSKGKERTRRIKHCSRCGKEGVTSQTCGKTHNIGHAARSKAA